MYKLYKKKIGFFLLVFTKKNYNKVLPDKLCHSLQCFYLFYYLKKVFDFSVIFSTIFSTQKTNIIIVTWKIDSSDLDKVIECRMK